MKYAVAVMCGVCLPAGLAVSALTPPRLWPLALLWGALGIQPTIFAWHWGLFRAHR